LVVGNEATPTAYTHVVLLLPFIYPVKMIPFIVLPERHIKSPVVVGL
jgi:hypothetical protein